MNGNSPTARALLALELVQNSPGISGETLGQRLGVSDRAARRYVGILREAGIPVESTPGRYGGYRLGRGYRVPPLMFSPTEALGLVMATLEGRHSASDDDDPVGRALGKIIRVLPASLADPADALWQLSTPRRSHTDARPDPETTAALVQASAARHRVRLDYRLRGSARSMDVDPWAVSRRHGLWYLLGWSHTKDARRVLRVDRIARVERLPETFEEPAGLDPEAALEEHLAEGWRYGVEVVVDAPVEVVGCWIPRNLGRLAAIDRDHTRLVGSTDAPDWYARRLVLVEAPFHVISPPELRDALRALGRRVLDAAD